jgi:CDP-glucose 4,6-dehydratase
MVRNPWLGRKVFLTGHTGFKGGWLALWLARMGATVRGYALDPDSEPNFFETARVFSMIEDIRGDLRDQTKLDRAMRDFRPEVVFHLAAQPLVRRSYADPVGTYATNVLGTTYLLESLRTLPSVSGAVIVTTDKCYQNREWSWGYREVDALGGFDPYSSSKACVEILCASFRNSFFSPQGNAEHPIALATARAGNVIGGGDWSENRLIPDLIRGFIRGEPVPIRQPLSIRPWQHVLEPLAGYLQLGERLIAGDFAFADAWNFGPRDDDEWTVARIATAVAERWAQGARWVTDGTEGVHEARFLKLDSAKARTALGWRSRLTLKSALDWSVDWYHAWHSGAEMQDFSLAQIANYERVHGAE